MTQTRHWGPSAPGGRGRGVKHILGKYQARGRRQETSPGDRPGAPPALQSDLLPSAPRGVSSLLASPSSFTARPARHPFFFHKVSRGVCVQDVVPPPSGSPPRAHPPRLRGEPLPSHPARGRRPDTRGTNSAGSCTRQTPVPPGLREIWGRKHRQQWARSREV